MILYIVDTTNNGVKIFECEKKLNTYLTNEKLVGKNISHYNVTTYEAEVKSTSNGVNIIENYSSSITRDNKLDAALGDEYASNVERLKQMIVELAKPGKQKYAFISKLNITSFSKSEISALLRGHSDFILYEFPLSLTDCLEYYKLLLKLHNFRNIKDRFVRETYNSSGYLHSRGYCVTPKICLTNFKLAKEL